MPAGLQTTPSEAPSFEGSIKLPYKLTTGPAAGAFLAELANHRIIGSRCSDGGHILAPAQDFCARCGSATTTLVELGGAGTVTAFTETGAGVIALIRIDGADTDMAHRLLDVDYEQLSVGQRVIARWADEPKGTMLDLEGFVLGDDASSSAEVRELQSETEPIAEQPYELDLRYQHAYGPYYGRMFDELASSRRILGVRSPTGEVLVPPREYDEVTFEKTGEWVDVADTGVIQGFSIIHLEFVGQTRKPPYVYAEIILDGAATRLIHTIGNVGAEEAQKRLRPGMRVRAVWKDDAEPTGTLEDIEYFELIED